VFAGGVLHVMLPQTCGATSNVTWPPRAQEIRNAAAAISARVPIAEHRYISVRPRERENIEREFAVASSRTCALI
jgi:hypothetical protein